MTAENYTNQVINCGKKSVAAGVLFLIAFYLGEDIVEILANGFDVLREFFGSIYFFVMLFEFVGELHFSIHVVFYTIFAWSYCVWWKIGAFNPCESIQWKSFGYMNVAFYVAYFVCLTGAYYSPGIIRLVEFLVGVVMCLMYGASFIGFRNKKSGPEEFQ